MASSFKKKIATLDARKLWNKPSKFWEISLYQNFIHTQIITRDWWQSLYNLDSCVSLAVFLQNEGVIQDRGRHKSKKAGDPSQGIHYEKPRMMERKTPGGLWEAGRESSQSRMVQEFEGALPWCGVGDRLHKGAVDTGWNEFCCTERLLLLQGG